VVYLSVQDAIEAIEDEYEVRISYSKQVIPYEEMVALNINTDDLSDLLKELKTQTGIESRQKGRRVVLKYQLENEEVLARSAQESIELPPSQPIQHPENDEVASTSLNTRARVPKEVLFQPRRREEDRIAVLEKIEEKDPRVLSVAERTSNELKTLEVREEEIYLAQFSIVPGPKNTEHKQARKYRFSVNAVAGVTGGVQGLEIGGAYNGIKRNLEGVQVAGVTNYIAGNIWGGQIAGGINLNKGIIRGVQVAGAGNINHQADALQLAGLFNYNREISRGFQFAGMFNISRNIAGSQMASFFNYASGYIDVQVSGFANIADETDMQVAGLVNVARKVDYFQLGLINIADTVGGASFGLLNLIRKGYNKVEFSVGETMLGNVAVKLGTRKFYNIFQISSNFKKNISNNGLIWGYGYGFGFFQGVDRFLKINPEVIVMNIHERNLLQPDLNLLSQVKLLFHFNRSSKTEYFAGPTLNWTISKIRDYDTTIVSSSIAPYDLWHRSYFRTSDIIDSKFWIGFSAGVRI
jgi:hypothetical protein